MRRVCLWLKPELSLSPESISGVSLGTLGFQGSATSAKGESELAFLDLSGKGDRECIFRRQPGATLQSITTFTRSLGILGPKLFFVTGLVIFVTAIARLVCPDLLG